MSWESRARFCCSWRRRRNIVRGMKIKAMAPMATPAIAPIGIDLEEDLFGEGPVSLLEFDVPFDGALMAITLEAAPSIQVHWFIEKLPRS